MKTPFPALYIAPPPHVAPGVMVHPCRVVGFYPDTEQAAIEIPSHVGGGRVWKKIVPFSDLASTKEKAALKVAAAIAHIVGPLPSSPAPAEKSASLSKAGAVAGASLANPELGRA